MEAQTFRSGVTAYQGPQNFTELINIFINLIQLAIPLLVGLALLAFLWGLTKFIARVGGDEKAVTEGKNLMIWGVIALFIMVSVWGIIGFFQRTFNLPTNTTQNSPEPGILPSRNVLPQPGNAPQPGNLPSRQTIPISNTGI